MGKIAYSLILTMLVASYSVTFGQAIAGNSSVVCVLTSEAQKRLEKSAVPVDAQHKKEIVWRKTAPEQFHAVLALMQVVTVAPCRLPNTEAASVTIRAIRLIERNPKTEDEEVVSEVTSFSSKDDPAPFEGKLFERLPHWYPSFGKVTDPGADMIRYEDKRLVIDLAKKPNAIYHGWTNPKVATKPGMSYEVEMEVKIVGAARLQMGIDFWRNIDSVGSSFDETCQKSTNCEGSLSRWVGPTDGFKTVRLSQP